MMSTGVGFLSAISATQSQDMLMVIQLETICSIGGRNGLVLAGWHWLYSMSFRRPPTEFSQLVRVA